MAQIGKIIAGAASRTCAAGERLLNGVTADTFARMARPGGTLVRSNHPAFVFGHLALYPIQVIERLVEAHQTVSTDSPDDRAYHAALQKALAATRHPPEWDALFKAGAECVDDPERRIYPPMAAVTKAFLEGYPLAIAAVAEASDALLTSPNPAEGRMRELCPMLGSMLTFYLDGHCHMHFGQISAWRRMMGLGAA